MMFATSVESRHSLRYAIELNKWIPVHAGASGLAILAFLDDNEIHSVIERTRLTTLMDHTITEAHRLQTEIEAIRQRGYAITQGPRIPGAVGLAAPIFGSDGRLIGDICLTIPQQRFDPASVTHIARLLIDCTTGITSDIGGIRKH
jgi:IclR family acetate operon transcriptional repressor